MPSQQIIDSDGSFEDVVPEYDRFQDPDSESMDEIHQKKPPSNIKYRLKTFDDELDSDQSQGEHARRGPKLIKFKQKKQSDRINMSHLKGEKDEKSDILDLYTPKNTQHNNKIEIFKPYKGFEKPEFF